MNEFFMTNFFPNLLKLSAFSSIFICMSLQILNLLVVLAVSLFDLEVIILSLQKEIAQLTCECERHIGTQSGGMDQVMQSNTKSWLLSYRWTTAKCSIQISCPKY